MMTPFVKKKKIKKKNRNKIYQKYIQKCMLGHIFAQSNEQLCITCNTLDTYDIHLFSALLLLFV